jgi:hypothetical protein
MKFLDFIINNNIIVDNTKYSPHPYIKEYYDELFSSLNNKKIKLLEIGVRSGISLLMWSDWFSKGEIYGLDINLFVTNKPNIHFTQMNAYMDSTLNLYENNTFDFIIDDGPHTPETQRFTIQYWIEKLKPGGKLIIEDIGCKDDNENNLSSEESLDFLIQSINKKTSDYKVFDLREKGQYDSIILEITKK